MDRDGARGGRGAVPRDSKRAPPGQGDRSSAPEIAELRGESLPPRLAQTIAALLQKNPRDRPQSASEALAMLDGERLPRRLSGRARTALIFAAAAAIGIALGILVLVAVQAWSAG